MYEFLTLPNRQPQNRMPFLLTVGISVVISFCYLINEKKQESNLLTYELC